MLRQMLLSNRRHGRIPIRISTLMILLFLIAISISYGDEEARLTVVNKTEHYLNVIIDGSPFLYVSPERGVTHKSSAKPTFSVTVFFSPGQGVSGKIDTTLSVPYTSGDFGCSYGNQSGCDCSTTPADAGAAMWEVTDSMLTTAPKIIETEEVLP